MLGYSLYQWCWKEAVSVRLMSVGATRQRELTLTGKRELLESSPSVLSVARSVLSEIEGLFDRLFDRKQPNHALYLLAVTTCEQEVDAFFNGSGLASSPRIRWMTQEYAKHIMVRCSCSVCFQPPPPSFVPPCSSGPLVLHLIFTQLLVSQTFFHLERHPRLVAAIAQLSVARFMPSYTTDEVFHCQQITPQLLASFYHPIVEDSDLSETKVLRKWLNDFLAMRADLEERWNSDVLSSASAVKEFSGKVLRAPVSEPAGTSWPPKEIVLVQIVLEPVAVAAANSATTQTEMVFYTSHPDLLRTARDSIADKVKLSFVLDAKGKNRVLVAFHGRNRATSAKKAPSTTFNRSPRPLPSSVPADSEIRRRQGSSIQGESSGLEMANFIADASDDDRHHLEYDL